MKKMMMFGVVVLLAAACRKDKNESTDLRYYEVGTRSAPAEWRDSVFVVATKNLALIAKIEAELALPVSERKIVAGALVAGDGGYNRNGSHNFKWHFDENDWDIVDLTIEVQDGRPYTDLDLNTDYWLNTVKRFGPWSSYIKREVRNE